MGSAIEAGGTGLMATKHALELELASAETNETLRPTVKHIIGPNGRYLTLADLPLPDTKRWVIRRKAEVVAAVRGGLLSLEEACSRYDLDSNEFISWERCIDRFGLAGLRTTRTQFYLRRVAAPKSLSLSQGAFAVSRNRGIGSSSRRPRRDIALSFAETLQARVLAKAEVLGEQRRQEAEMAKKRVEAVQAHIAELKEALAKAEAQGEQWRREAQKKVKRADDLVAELVEMTS
jgi:uncharacterized protein DUF1153